MNKNLHVLGGSVLGALALVSVAVLPASAAASGGTEATFTLAAGTLDVVVVASAPLTVTGNEASGKLGNVVVTNDRGNTVAWNASVAVTNAFDTAGTVATNVAYATGALTPGGAGTVSLAGSDVAALTTEEAVVVAATEVVGNHTAIWNPTLTVTLPGNRLAGAYSGTVTTSVL